MVKLIGVAILDLSNDGLVALKWASDFLVLPEEYKLCIIIVVGHDDTPNIGPDLEWGDQERELEAQIEHAAAEDTIIDSIQAYASKFGFENVITKFCRGPDTESTLQETIDQLPGLNTLVLACAGRDGGNMLNNMAAADDQIKLSGCSIVLVKTDGDNRGTSLSFSAPAAAPPAPPAPPAANQPAAPPPAPPAASQSRVFPPAPPAAPPAPPAAVANQSTVLPPAPPAAAEEVAPPKAPANGLETNKKKKKNRRGHRTTEHEEGTVASGTRNPVTTASPAASGHA